MNTVALGKYMTATEEKRPRHKTSIWHIDSKSGDLLGLIQWFPRWRQYVLSPVEDTVFSRDCLEAIIGFMASLAHAEVTEQTVKLAETSPPFVEAKP